MAEMDWWLLNQVTGSIFYEDNGDAEQPYTPHISLYIYIYMCV